MGSDITAHRMSIGMFYARAYSSLLKRYSIFFRFGIIDFLSLVSLISNFSRFIACKCYSPFTINIQFTLFLLLLLVLGNDVHPNPGPQDYELSIFHLNARSVRNKLSYVEDIASESSIICVTESHLDTNIIDNDILIDGFFDQILRKDRNCFGGGVLVYTSQDICVKPRYDLNKLARRNQSNQSLQKYKSQRNKVNNMIKYAREQFFLSANELVNSLQSKNSKSYWTFVKRLMKGTGNNYTIPPLYIGSTGELVYEDKAKANLLNQYFCSITSINDSNREPPNVVPRTHAILSNIDVNIQDVKDILQTLQIGKACGDDGISHQMLKATSETICLPLSILFTYSLRTCKFPSDWKLARVMPSFKKDDKSSPSNYRPISLLSWVGKVMERVVYKYIYNYIIEHSLLYSYQSGFLPGHSTVYQLLEIYHNICKNIDNRLSSIIVFCDISKAFDRVWHKALLKKLQSYGITGDLLLWLDDYVSDREQKVVVNNECSNFNTVKAGVPQGSVLGPLLFLLYINDITDNLGNLARLFADDTSLSYFGRNYDIMESDINNDLSKLNEWAKLWLVDFNPKKTKALVISTSAVPHLDLRFNGEPVEIVKTHKHLGLTFASDGNWTNHIDNIVNAAFKQVNVLRKLKFTLSKQILSNIYLTLIRPKLEYACEVWDGCFEREVAKLEKVQLESARIVTGLPKFASRDSLYYETGWEPLSCRRKSRKLTTFYKMHNKVCPQYLCNCLPPTVSSISDHNL